MLHVTEACKSLSSEASFNNLIHITGRVMIIMIIETIQNK